MYLNYAKIKSNQRKQPMLRLQTLSGKELGPIPYAHDVKLAINYADLSTISFKVPCQVNGMINPLYSMLTSYKVIYTEDFGIYVLTSPTKDGDGVLEEKTINGYSLEYLFSTKDLFLEEGTYNFWNPISPSETILGRIIELDPTWHVGYVAPRLVGCYRTFDQYSDNALNFCYGDAMEKYRCAFVFNVYDRSINVYDTSKDAVNLPIYLDYKNLIESIEVQEITDEMATKLHLYGSDDLSIRDVNPMGTDYIVDLSYFLNNGDLDIKVGNSSITLADKVRKWQIDIAEQQQYYIGVVSSRATLTARKLAAEVDLTELKNERETLVTQQSVIIQAYALETTDSGKRNQQNKLDQINAQIAAKDREITAQENNIASIQSQIDGYVTEINSIVKNLALTSYFTKEEQGILSQYMIEATVEDETFVATDVDTSSSGVVTKISGSISITESTISRVSLSKFSKTMYMLNGGKVSIPNIKLSAEIVRGTLDVGQGNSYVLSLYLGSVVFSEHEFDNGILTVNGTLSQLFTDIATRVENGITEYIGSRMSFSTSGASSYFTVDANEFQQYSVALELYDFGYELLSDYAWPVYEFSVNSANFLYHEKFEPFKNNLELGKAVYLNMGTDGILHAKIIGIELDFEHINDFKLIFSNRYRLKNGVEEWIDEIRNVSRSSRRFDVSKYLYNQTADKMSSVAQFISDSLDAAKNTILGAKNQSVVIDGAGIHVGGDSPHQIRIVNSMIAISDDNWETCKLAIGYFASPEVGEYFGVNAEVIGGNLIVGNNLVIDTNNGHFKVDSSGVYVNSLKFYINNGKSLSDKFDDISSDINGVSSQVSSVRKDFDSVTTKTSNGITLNADDLKGVISAQQAQMRSGGGNVLFDSDGMWLLNAATKATATKAIWMNENGILFGSGSRTSDPGRYWTNWTTAIGHDGIVANNIAAGTLSGMTINGGSITIGKSSTSDNAYLYVDTNGNLGIGRNTSKSKGYNFYVDSNGNMYAESGTFAGSLNGATGTFSGSLNAATGTFSGSLNAATGTFKGSLQAATGTFSGDISAASGVFKGTIQAARYLDTSGRDMMTSGKFTADYLDLKGLNINNRFMVDYLGNVTINGGSISWGTITGTYELDNRISSAQSTANNAQSTANSAYNLAAANQVPYYIKSTYIDSTTIMSPTISGNVLVGTSFRLSNGFGSIDVGYGATDVGSTYGIKMAGGYGYFIATNAGARMQAGSTNIYCNGSSITASSEILTSSDRRAKNSISYDMERYEGFFHALEPCVFRYNNDTTKKLHIGYIAQDVKAAMDKSGLDLSEFAGYMSGVSANLKDCDDELALGYSEFTALNTFMIQKLYRKVNELQRIVDSIGK